MKTQKIGCKKLAVLMTVSLMSACGSDTESSPEIIPPEPDGALTYSLNIKSKDNNIELENAQIRVRLYGTHRYVADNEATLIADSVEPIEDIPTTVELLWPENDYQLIDSPPVSVEEDASYFIHVSIDANGDGVVCEGDYTRDYDETPVLTFYEIPTSRVEVYVTARDDDSCTIFE